MADHCGFCDTRRPIGGTNMLIVNQGDWLEFCGPCGESEVLTNGETGEEITVRALFDRCSKDGGSLPEPEIETPDLGAPEDLRLMLGFDPALEE